MNQYGVSVFATTMTDRLTLNFHFLPILTVCFFFKRLLAGSKLLVMFFDRMFLVTVFCAGRGFCSHSDLFIPGVLWRFGRGHESGAGLPVSGGVRCGSRSCDHHLWDYRQSENTWCYNFAWFWSPQGQLVSKLTFRFLLTSLIFHVTDRSLRLIVYPRLDTSSTGSKETSSFTMWRSTTPPDLKSRYFQDSHLLSYITRNSLCRCDLKHGVVWSLRRSWTSSVLRWSQGRLQPLWARAELGRVPLYSSSSASTTLKREWWVWLLPASDAKGSLDTADLPPSSF